MKIQKVLSYSLFLFIVLVVFVVGVSSVFADVPTVTVTSPNGGEFWSGIYAVTWSADDADGDRINSGQAGEFTHQWGRAPIGQAEKRSIIER